MSVVYSLLLKVLRLYTNALNAEEADGPLLVTDSKKTDKKDEREGSTPKNEAKKGPSVTYVQRASVALRLCGVLKEKCTPEAFSEVITFATRVLARDTPVPLVLSAIRISRRCKQLFTFCAALLRTTTSCGVACACASVLSTSGDEAVQDLITICTKADKGRRTALKEKEENNFLSFTRFALAAALEYQFLLYYYLC